MADDVARKLNAINEDYNARTVPVFLEGGNYTFANIERNIIKEYTSQIENNDTNDQNNTSELDNTNDQDNTSEIDNTNNQNDTSELDNANQSNNTSELDNTDEQNSTNESDNTNVSNDTYVEDDEKFDITNVMGNHAVVLMDIPNEDITLVVDPTNIGIGIFQNGKITMFNSYTDNPLEIKMKPLGAAIWGTEDLIEVPSNYINSLGSKDIEELRKIWGVEAQNKALDEVREEFKTNKEQFNESLKYDIANNNSTNNIDNEKNQNKEIESER